MCYFSKCATPPLGNSTIGVVQSPGSWHSNQQLGFECVHGCDTQQHDPACGANCTDMVGTLTLEGSCPLSRPDGNSTESLVPTATKTTTGSNYCILSTILACGENIITSSRFLSVMA